MLYLISLKNMSNIFPIDFGFLGNHMRANIYQIWQSKLISTTKIQDRIQSTLRVFLLAMVLWTSKMGIFKKIKPNIWLIITLLTQIPLLTGIIPVKLILTQLDADISISDWMKILNSLIFIVYFWNIEDVYGYCFYNDSFLYSEKERRTFHSQ